MEQIRKQEGALNQYFKYISSVGLVQAATTTITGPLERYKIIKQAQEVLTINDRYKYRTFAQYIMRIPKEQGIQAFWRGNFANVLNIIPRAGAQFLFYDNVQRTFFPQGEASVSGGSYVLNKFLAAMSCGLLSLTLTYPLDTVRVRLSLEFSKKKENRLFKGVLQTLGETKTQQGMRQLYRGFLLSNMINLHYFITFYCAVDIIKNAELREYLQGDASRFLNYIGVAQIGSLAALISVYPLDTIRKRLQQNGYNRSPNLKYKNTLDCFNKIKTQEGFSALFAGLTPNIVKFGIASTLQVYLLNELINNNMTFLN
ncbi:Mitochondrial carrier domain [Pseudocohnilembus persalinus]|uniref:Mitochondrial carrier domain n=1 Tax=Pseudocohnilembus persalinus TaxID=266149 RepID=A0A0V0QN18_PSEPJ|nr:Mitochondrial carrier domain [Pseudocohnilembus persalinus]|eukprot:KRX03638.1 Mitochondrial carrier domain [Pseudocohnilembus persalinus]